MICVYPIVVFVITWPLLQQLTSSVIGMVNVDLIDTVSLRSFDQEIGFWPFSYPFTNLQPNKIDAYSFLLFRSLGFPLADNLWWFCILTLNGYAAHFMGHSIKGSFRDGLSCGIFFLFSETILRESTLHHAPQILVMWFPLYIGSVFWWKKKQNNLSLVGMTLSLLFCGLSYWYYALFLFIASMGLLATDTYKAILSTAILVVVCLIPFALTVMHTPIVDVPNPVLSSNSWFFTALPADKSSRFPIVLIVFCLVRHQQILEKRIAFWCIGIAVLFMLFSINGNLSEQVSLIANSQKNVPILSRLHWPERWSILLHIGGAILAAQASWRWIIAILLEQIVFSANLPIPTTPTTSLSCLKQLTQVDGPVLMLPMETSVNLAGMYHRIHEQSVHNPFVLPPGHTPPSEWIHSPLTSFDIPTAEQIHALGIAAVFIDKTPWTQLSKGQINTITYKMTQELGTPQDIGCAYVWSKKPLILEETEYIIAPPSGTKLYSFDNFWIFPP